MTEVAVCPFAPVGERVILQLEQVGDRTASGLLYVPDTAKDAPQFATVVALGDAVEEPIAVGDKVVFGKYSAASFKHEGEEYYVIRSEEILAVLKSND
jgi:chaperonin GroES